MRNDSRPRFEPRTSRGYGAPRALIVGIALFVIALGVLAAVLFVNGNNVTPRANVGTLSSPTPRATSTGPAAVAVATATATAPIRLTATTVTAGSVPTATVTEPQSPQETPTDAPTDSAPAPTPTVEPVTETPTAAPAPSVAPAVGEFGQLPTAEIPSGGLARDLNLSYALGVSLDSAPSTAVVYQLIWPERTAGSVAALAANLGITGAVDDQGNGNFKVDGGSGSLYVTAGVVQISLNHPTGAGDLGDEASVIAAARAWLLDNNLASAGLGAGAVTSTDSQAKRATVFFDSADPTPLLAAYPSARVTVGPGGGVFEAYIKWPASYATAVYPLSSATDLWAAVQAGKGFIEANLSAVPGQGPLSGTLTVTNVSLAYTTAGSASGGGFLVPILVFSGNAILGDSATSVPISIYVPAVAGQVAPRG